MFFRFPYFCVSGSEFSPTLSFIWGTQFQQLITSRACIHDFCSSLALNPSTKGFMAFRGLKSC